MSALIFQKSDQGRLKISEWVISTTLLYVQDTIGKPEAGGVLLGRHILGSQDIVIDEVTVPLRGDKQKRFRFFRSKKRHQEAIDLAWKQSGGTATYLGEWHTHPEEFPNPSFIDIINWQKKLLLDKYTEPLFFIIVGTKQIRVWQGVGKTKIVLLKELENK